jgi:hypothetical protein
MSEITSYYIESQLIALLYRYCFAGCNLMKNIKNILQKKF